MRSLRKCERGVEGLPLEMIIIIVVVAIIVPITFSYFTSWNTERTEQSLQNEFEYLAARIKMVYMTGENNTDIVDMDISGGMLTPVEWVSIGLDPDAGIDGQKTPASIAYKLKGRPEQAVLVQNPEIPMAWNNSGNYESLVLGSGTHTIFMQVKKDPAFSDWPDGVYVEVSVAE